MSSWQLRVLGDGLLIDGGRRFTLERKTAALLAYLALQGPSPRSKLAGLLWPDSTEGKARNNLSQLLRRLRKNTGSSLVSRSDLLGLSDELRVDVAQFKLASFAGRYAELARSSTDLLSHYDYDDCLDFGDWLLSEREQLAAMKRAALYKLTANLAAESRFDEALPHVESLLELDPLSEEAHRTVMRLHYLAGDRPAALRAYSRCKAVLQHELGVGPMPDTVELAREIEGDLLSPQPAPRPRAALPLAVQRPPLLAGREREWARLEEAWDAGQVIFISGEPGVGKSRLMFDFVASKGPHGAFLCRPGDAGVPYALDARGWRRALEAFPDLPLEPWAKLELSRILPELATRPLPPIASEQEKLRFYQAMAHLVELVTERGWVAMVVDDLHYIDDASFEAGNFMIAKFVPQPHPSRPRSVNSFRRGELRPEIEAGIRALVDSGLAILIELEPLDETGVAALLGGLGLPGTDSLAQPLTRFAGGNPLFVVETLKSLFESGRLNAEGLARERDPLPLSGKVGSLLRLRLERLSPEALHLCWSAAVAGEDFGLELAAEVLDTGALELAAPWQELESRQILAGGRFSHDLLYETALATIPAPVRALLHRRCAAHLEKRHSSAARIAQHYLQAGDHARAVPLLTRAAEEARAAFRLQEAANFFEQAADILQEQGGTELFATLLALHGTLNLYDFGERHDDVVERLCGSATDPRQKAQAWSAKADYLEYLGRGEESEAAARTGYQHAESVGDHQLMGALLKNLGTALIKQGKLADAVETLEQSSSLLEPFEEHHKLAEVHDALANALGELDRYEEAIRYKRSVLETLTRAEDNHGRAITLSGIAIHQRNLGRSQEALDTLADMNHLLLRTNEAPLADILHWMMRAGCLADLADYTGALDSVQRALAKAQDLKHWLYGAVLKFAAQIYLDLGQADSALHAITTGLEQPGLTGQQRSVLLIAQANISIAHGKPATGALQEARALLQPMGKRLTKGNLLVTEARVLPAESSIRSACEALETARALELGGLQIAAETRCAQALLALQRPEEALQSTTSALRLLESRQPVDFYRGEVLLTHYRAKAMLEDPQADCELQHCLDWVTEVASHKVPRDFHESFLAQNPINRDILQAAELAGLTPALPR